VDSVSLAELKVAFISIVIFELGRLITSWWAKPGFYHEPLDRASLNGDSAPTSTLPARTRRNKRKWESLPVSTRQTRFGTAGTGAHKPLCSRRLDWRPFTSLDHAYWWYTGGGRVAVQTRFFGGTIEWWRDYDKQYGREDLTALDQMEGIGVVHSKGCGVLGNSSFVQLQHPAFSTHLRLRCASCSGDPRGIRVQRRRERVTST